MGCLLPKYCCRQECDDTEWCVNRKRSESMFGTISTVLHSPWSLSIAVLILLLSVELVDTKSSLEPWQTIKNKIHTQIRSARFMFQPRWLKMSTTGLKSLYNVSMNLIRNTYRMLVRIKVLLKTLNQLFTPFSIFNFFFFLLNC